MRGTRRRWRRRVLGAISDDSNEVIKLVSVRSHITYARKYRAFAHVRTCILTNKSDVDGENVDVPVFYIENGLGRKNVKEKKRRSKERDDTR